MSATKYFPPRVTADTWPLIFEAFDSSGNPKLNESFNKPRLDEIPWWDGDLFRITGNYDDPLFSGIRDYEAFFRLFLPAPASVRLRADKDAVFASASATLRRANTALFPFGLGGSVVFEAGVASESATMSDEDTQEVGPGLYIVAYYLFVDDVPDAEVSAEIEWSPA